MGISPSITYPLVYFSHGLDPPPPPCDISEIKLIPASYCRGSAVPQYRDCPPSPPVRHCSHHPLPDQHWQKYLPASIPTFILFSLWLFSCMKRLDQGHLHSKPEVPRLTSPGWDFRTYSEHPHMSPGHDSPQCLWLHERT